MSKIKKVFGRCIALISMLIYPILSLAQTEVPSTSAIFPVLLYLKGISQSFPEPLEIDGDYLFNPVSLNGPSLLATKELRMRPGSRLILTGPFSSVGNSREAILISALKITIMPNKDGVNITRRPSITWLNPNEIGMPPRTGKAPPGRQGDAPGASGVDGATGMPGNPGFQGIGAPHIYLAVNEIVGGTILIDLRGKSGGKGGDGQDGGDGGPGASGASSVSSIFDCKSGPGQGGNGGRGGRGGDGGSGGKGGDGGSIFLISPRDKMAGNSHSIIFQGNGGNGGEGGETGGVGLPGREGAEGRIGGFCGTANRAGKPGLPQTEKGSKGATGPNGTSGTWYLFPTDSLF